MGIPFYFASLNKTHTGITQVIKKCMNVDILAIDFNCLIHRYLKDDDPYQSILNALEHIVQTTCNAKQIMIAMDGIVPYGKIVQQRYRRFRNQEARGTFDRNQISPGTEYMKQLDHLVRERFPTYIVSSTLEEGEGEHKLFSWIRTLPEKQRRSICIYGLDADLILLSLAQASLSKENQMWLLRESAEFDDPKLKQAEFSTLSIWKLKLCLPISIEQYITLCVLCFGNDFMPNLGMFSLREDGYERALHLYNKCGSPDLRTTEGRRIFLSFAGTSELSVLSERIRLRRQPLEKTIVGKDRDLISFKYGLHILDGVYDMNPVVDAFWKTFHWTLNYFDTNTTNNWSWTYPYADAPLITDILEYGESGPPNSSPRKFTVNDQLKFILPAKSLRNTKRLVAFHDEMHTETRHTWMKRHEWEMKPRISLPWNPDGQLTTVTALVSPV